MFKTGSLLIIAASIWSVSLVRAATAQLNAGDIKTVVADNQSYGAVHKGGYNGLAELYHGSLQRNIFVSRYAGMNFEFIVSGDSNSFDWHIFEPRRSAMTLTEVPDSTARLFQARTLNWPLQTTITFTLAGDNAIDFIDTRENIIREYETWSGMNIPTGMYYYTGTNAAGNPGRIIVIH